MVQLRWIHPLLGGLGGFAYLYRMPSEECSLFFAETNRNWSYGRLASDAEFVCWQHKREGHELLIFCNDSYVEIDGRRVLGCEQKVARCEMLSHDGRGGVFSSDAKALVEEQLTSSEESASR